MGMSDFKAKVHRPTGFSDVESIIHDVVVVGFVYGRHPDAIGYDRSGECAMAVCREAARVYTVPLSWVVPETLE
jgi:hypothetical protein